MFSAQMVKTKKGQKLFTRVGLAHMGYDLIDEKSSKDIENVRKALTSDRNAIIEVLTQEDTKIVPKLEVEHPIEDISPRLSEEELKESMLISPYKKEKRTQGASHCLK